MPTTKPRILTGDTPTGRLHLGHWVGSVENRLAMQEAYDCYFLIANVHAFTNPERAKHSAERDGHRDGLAGGGDRSHQVDDDDPVGNTGDRGVDVFAGDADSVFAGDEESDDQGGASGQGDGG